MPPLTLAEWHCVPKATWYCIVATTPAGRFRTPSVPGIAYSPSPSGASILHNDSASGGPLLSRMLVAFGSTHRPQP